MTTLLIAIGVVVGSVAVLSVIGFFIYKHFKKQQPIIKSKPENTVDSKSPIKEDDEVYEDQYHPKAEIGDIFADSDKKKQKVNEADGVSKVDETNEDISKVEHSIDGREGSIIYEQTPLHTGT